MEYYQANKYYKKLHKRIIKIKERTYANIRNKSILDADQLFLTLIFYKNDFLYIKMSKDPSAKYYLKKTNKRTFWWIEKQKARIWSRMI